MTKRRRNDLGKYQGRYKFYKQRCQEIEDTNQEVSKRQELDINNLTQTVDEKSLEITNLEKGAKQQDLKITKLTNVVSALETVKAQQSLDIAKLAGTTATQSRLIVKLEETAVEQRNNITGLTETILRSTYSINTATRDDEYFDAEFASLAGDIRQWIFRYFRNGPVVQHQDLLPTAQQSMGVVILDYDTRTVRDLGTIVSAKEIEAAVIQRLSQHIFDSPFAFGLCSLKYPSILQAIGGTGRPYIVRYPWGTILQRANTRRLAREKRELHAQMVNMLMKNDQFDTHFREGISLLENDIQKCFGGLAKVGGDHERRHSELHRIAEKAAQLGIETYRQVSEFKLMKTSPGDVYDPRFMEDKLGTVDKVEEEGGSPRHCIVQMVVFPPVLRFGFDEAGEFVKHPIVVRKATVRVIRLAEAGAGAGAGAVIDTRAGGASIAYEAEADQAEEEAEAEILGLCSKLPSTLPNSKVVNFSSIDIDRR